MDPPCPGNSSAISSKWLQMRLRYVVLVNFKFNQNLYECLLKCICTQKILFDMWKGHILEVHWPIFKERVSSSNEIILHKVSKITGSERTLQKTTLVTPALFAGFMGTILGTNFIVSSQTLNFVRHYFITWWIFLTECRCNGLLYCVPFTYQKIFFWLQVHFNIESEICPQTEFLVLNQCITNGMHISR